MKKIEDLKIGDVLFDMEAGESSMKEFVEANDDFDVSTISSTSLCCENPQKNIDDTVALSGVILKESTIKKHCIVTGIDKHSKFRWTLFGCCVYSATRIVINVFDVQFDR